MKVCSIDTCARPPYRRGLCSPHATRWYRAGDAAAHEPVGSRPRQNVSHFLGEAVGYMGIHKRLRLERGRAAEHSCVDCGNIAAQWSLSSEAPEQKSDRWGTFTTDLMQYDPRCVPCHNVYDRGKVA